MTCRWATLLRYGRGDGALVIHGMWTLPMSTLREGGPITQILGHAWSVHSRGGVSPMSTTRGMGGWFAPTPSVARPLRRRRPIRSRPLEEERTAYPFRYACARNPFRAGGPVAEADGPGGWVGADQPQRLTSPVIMSKEGEGGDFASTFGTAVCGRLALAGARGRGSGACIMTEEAPQPQPPGREPLQGPSSLQGCMP